MKNTIEKWLNASNKDYLEGIILLEKAGARPRIVHMFRNRSPRFAMNELAYNLKKIAENLPQSSKVETTVPSDQQHNEKDSSVVNEEERYKDSAAGIAKRIVQELRTEISRLHNDLFDIGVANDEISMTRRRDILEERKPLIVRYNEVFESKEMFFSGEIDEQQLLDVINFKNNSPEVAVVDIDKLSGLELAKRIKAAKACITRCNNQLKYQRDTAIVDGKPATENPMPDCPNRDKIKARLAGRTAELVQLNAEFSKRGLDGNA